MHIYHVIHTLQTVYTCADPRICPMDICNASVSAAKDKNKNIITKKKKKNERWRCHAEAVRNVASYIRSRDFRYTRSRTRKATVNSTMRIALSIPCGKKMSVSPSSFPHTHVILRDGARCNATGIPYAWPRVYVTTIHYKLRILHFPAWNIILCPSM